MRFAIQRGAAAPAVHTQLAEAVCQAIVAGQLHVDEQLPTELALARDLQVNRTTISRGYDLLRQRGILIQKRARGSFVSPAAPGILGIRPRRQLRSVAFVFSEVDLEHVPSQNRFIIFDLLTGLNERFQQDRVHVSPFPLGRPETATVNAELLARAAAFDAFAYLPNEALFDQRMRALIRAGSRTPKPCLTLWGRTAEATPEIPFVMGDRPLGIRLAFEHLLARGYRRIGYLGSDDRTVFCSKYASFQQCLQQHESTARDGGFIHVELEMGLAHRRMLERLSQKSPLPEALIIDTDYKAMEAILALRSAGIRVPQDLGIVSYDNVVEADRFDPPLTTIAPPRIQAGLTAAQMLLDWPVGDGPPPASLLLPPELIVRASTRG